MPSFDVVSEVDAHELTNAVDQAQREISTRFDFKGVEAHIDHGPTEIVLSADSEFRVRQMLDILQKKAVKRGIDVQALDEQEIEEKLNSARLAVRIKQGIDKEVARKIVKRVKESKLKIQAAIQGEQVRVTGKKRDDLQSAIALLKDEDFGLPLQFTNFRD